MVKTMWQKIGADVTVKIFETGEGVIREGIKRSGKEVGIAEMEYHIVRNAMVKSDFFDFESIKEYCPKIKSIREFIEDKNYLGGLKINFQIDEYTAEISKEDKLLAVIKLLVTKK